MLTFSKQIQWFSSAILCITLSACGGDGDENKNLEGAQSYKADSPYAGVMENCIKAESDFCSLSALPLLGMDHNDASISNVLDRVVVSHSWMGDRFEEVLYEMPEAMLPLFRSVTSIVIHTNIRPAYYSSGTGAIYIDPAFLWLTLEEKRSVSTKQDYRAGFDDPLAFRQIQRYLKDGDIAYPNASLLDDSTRELEDIILLVARLLLHELAHANDFIPPNSYELLDTNLSVSQAAHNFNNQWISTLLSDAIPLESEVMHSMANVMYSGMTPNADDLELSASSIGAAFEPDGAGDDYGYTTQFEDLAMLFETTMMKFFFDADYELAFTSVPDDPTRCDNYLIGWGVRNRIGDINVLPRAQFAAEELLPHIDFGAFFGELDAPTEISGDWCLTIPDSALGGQKTSNPAIDPEHISRLPYL